MVPSERVLMSAIVGIIISVVLALGMALVRDILGDISDLARGVVLNSVRRLAGRTHQGRMVVIVDRRGRAVSKVAVPDDE